MFNIDKIIPINPNYNFLILRKIMIIFSIVFIFISIGLFFFKGLNLGIDFKGGVLIEIKVKNTNIGQLRDILSPNFDDLTLQEFGSTNNVIIKLQSNDGLDNITLVNSVKDLIGKYTEEFRRTEYVGPTISNELFINGIKAVIFAVISILIYIWFRFEWQFGFAAVIALIHDVLITLGILAIFNVDFNLSTIAAILTIAGYSINDSVVIFDRVRENLRKYKKMELIELFNLSINNTLSRTIMTSLTTLIALTSLFLLGGEVIKAFSFTMIIGVIIGTYSSMFIAIPTLMLFNFRRLNDDD